VLVDLKHVQSRLVYQIHCNDALMSVIIESPHCTLGVCHRQYDDDTQSITQYANNIYHGSPYWVAALFADKETIEFQHSCFDNFIKHRNAFLTRVFVDSTMKCLSHTSKNEEYLLRIGDMIVRWIDGDSPQLSKETPTCTPSELLHEIGTRLERCILPDSFSTPLLNHTVTESVFSFLSQRIEI